MELMVGMYVGTGLLLCILSIPMILKIVKPNGLYGFRVKKTLENPDIWYTANCYSGKWLLATGLITIMTAIVLACMPDLSIDAYALAVLAVFSIAFAISIMASVRYLKSL
jgi:hypothetical protein